MKIQMILSFLIWMGYAIWISKNPASLVEKSIAKSYKHPLFKGVIRLLIASFTLMLGLYILTYLEALGGGGLSLLGWFFSTLLGMFFVRMQVVGAAIIMSAIQNGRRGL